MVPSNSAARLTRRDYDMIEAVIDGLSNDEIASVYNLSPHTVKTYMHGVMGKVGAGTRSKLAAWGRDHVTSMARARETVDSLYDRDSIGFIDYGSLKESLSQLTLTPAQARDLAACLLREAA
jgi:DNA-binding CsgD family transcriptional regulator